MPAQLLARLDATPGDPWRDAAPAQRPPAARLVIALVQVGLDRALAGPAGPPTRSLDRRDRIDDRFQQHQIQGGSLQ
jgi:hypothetical protein